MLEAITSSHRSPCTSISIWLATNRRKLTIGSERIFVPAEDLESFSRKASPITQINPEATPHSRDESASICSESRIELNTLLSRKGTYRAALYLMNIDKPNPNPR